MVLIARLFDGAEEMGTVSLETKPIWPVCSTLFAADLARGVGSSEITASPKAGREEPAVGQSLPPSPRSLVRFGRAEKLQVSGNKGAVSTVGLLGRTR